MNAFDPVNDDQLDDALRGVSLPDGLLGRLTEIAHFHDETIDEQLQDVPLPQGLEARLGRLALLSKRRMSLEELVTAASMLLAVGLSYAAAMVLLLVVAYSPKPVATATWLDTNLPSPPVEMALSVIDLEDALRPLASDLQSPETGPSPLIPEIKLALVGDQPPAIDQAQSAMGHLPAEAGSRGGLLEADWHRWPLTAPLRTADDREVPELHRLFGLVPRGIDPPRVPGFDLVFLQLTGFHPVAVPAMHADLATSQVPLAAGTASYDLLRHSLQQGELPPPQMVRTEELLAALDYDFPSPRRRPLGLYAAGGPSPQGGTALRLLQVGVKAANVDDRRRQPAHLTVAIDTSQSMQLAGRLKFARQALRQLVERLRPEDRLSLLSFNSQAWVLMEDAGPQHAEQLLAAIASLQPAGGSNLGAGLRGAYTLAPTTSQWPNHRRQVVLISDGAQGLDTATVIQLEAALEAASAEERLPLTVIGLDRSPLPDMQLAGLAAAGGGRLVRADSQQQLRCTLLETLTGQPQQVAADVSLKIAFNPKVVLGYRLLGHEATPLLPAEPQGDLWADQSATGLYELQLNPEGGRHVADVLLTWRDPQSGRPQSLRSRVLRDLFSSTFAGEPGSLQLATLAAEMAEILRVSPFRSREATFKQLLDLSEQAGTETTQNASFRELVGMLRQATQARPPAEGVRRAWHR